MVARSQSLNESLGHNFKTEREFSYDSLKRKKEDDIKEFSKDTLKGRTENEIKEYSSDSLKRKKELRAASFANLSFGEQGWSSLPRKYKGSESPLAMERECSCGNTIRFEPEEEALAPPRPPTPERYCYLANKYMHRT